MPVTPTGLTYSTTPIRTTYDGQIIENLDLWVSSGDAIRVDNNDVVIRNVIIHHDDGNGIVVEDVSGVKVEDSLIVNSDPPSGNQGGSGNETTAIRVVNADHFTASHVTMQDSETGIYLGQSPNATLSFIEGHDFHGPFPAGQLVQFYESPNGTLTDFYAKNAASTSHVEDIVSVIDSRDITISRGLLDGNNSPSGVGVMFEGSSEGGQVDHVDTIHMGNGAFSSYSNDVTFDYTRSFDNISGDQGRGASLSNGLIWNTTGDDVQVLHSTYTDPAVSNNIVWGGSDTGSADVKAAPAATPMAAIVNAFDWTTNDGGSSVTAGVVVPAVTVTTPVIAVQVPATAGLDRDGTTASETLQGSAFADDLDGLAGNDTLLGLGGDDHLYGGEGRDILNGGSGTDHLWGGGGSDHFVFKAGNGSDWIEDFHHTGTARDVVEVDKSMFASFGAVQAAAHDVGTDVAITHGSDTLWIADIHQAQLSASDFLFV